MRTVCQYRQTGPISIGHYRSFRSRFAFKLRFLVKDNVWTIRRLLQNNILISPANALFKSFRIAFFGSISENSVVLHFEELDRTIRSRAADLRKFKEFNLTTYLRLVNRMFYECSIVLSVGKSDEEYLLESFI